jgi:hypothetical protein
MEKVRYKLIVKKKIRTNYEGQIINDIKNNDYNCFYIYGNGLIKYKE